MRFEIISRSQHRNPSKCWNKKDVLKALEDLRLQNLGSGFIIDIEFEPERRKEVETRLKRVSSYIAYLVRP